MKILTHLSLLTAVILLISSVTAFNNHNTNEKINLKEIVDDVNADTKSTWKADTYGEDEHSLTEIRKKLGLKSRSETSPADSDGGSKNNRKTSNSKNLRKLLSKYSSLSDYLARKDQKVGLGMILPKSYDVRQRYPKCFSVSHIRDQANCGSCWAVSAASVFSDRLCIHNEGRYNSQLSSRYILSCDQDNYGCDGGYLDVAWEFLRRNGTVSGGDFQSDIGCQPYPFRPCGYPKKYPCNPFRLTPRCLKQRCDNEYHTSEYENSTYKVEDWYEVNDGFLGFFNEYYIKKEIYLNGPVQVGFDVYADFMTYKSGIYEHKKRSRFLGGHAIKMIGWGEANGVKYWTLANSWGDKWGEKGFVRFIRGNSNCGIEDEVYAGIPKKLRKQ